MLLSLGQDLETEFLMSVLILHNSPFAIFVIKRHPIVLNVLINFDVTNLKAWEASVEFFGNPATKKLVYEQKSENDQQRPGGCISELQSKHSINGVMCGVR